MAYNMSQEEQLMYEKLYELMGARVKLSSDSTVYEGIIGTIIPGLRMVSLSKTTLCNGEFLGNTRFRFSEIKSLTVIESSEVVNRYPKNDYLLDILKNKGVKKYNICDILYDGQLSEQSDDEQSVNEELEEQEFTLELPPHLKNKLPNNFILIDSMDINFTQVIQEISEQDVIGVSFEGPRVSRFGKLAYICISTTSHVYLFDIEKLKNEAFDNGLRVIFEETCIKKVIHDCRFPSDCLAHQYSTQLTNVFDTQVADFIISMQHYNDKYKFKYISSLDCCLSNHLHVPPEFLHKRAKYSKDVEKDYFTKRPISNELKYDLIKNALYLILLYKTLARKMLSPLHKNVDAYLRVLANATDEEINTLGNELSPPDSIPPSILMYGIQTVRFKKPLKKDSFSLECKFLDPKTKKVIDPKKIVNSDSTRTEKKCLNSKDLKKPSIEVKKENFMLHKLSDHPKDVLSITSVEDIHSPPETMSKTVITVKPSLRHMDEVYHKLVNSLNFHSHQSESVINVKPADCYVSKFTFRKLFSDNDTPDLHTSREQNAYLNADSMSENLSTAKEITTTSEKSSDSNDFWASLSFSSDELTATSSLKEKYKNIQFVPA